MAEESTVPGENVFPRFVCAGGALGKGTVVADCARGALDLLLAELLVDSWAKI